MELKLKFSLITIIFMSLIAFSFACDCSKCKASPTNTKDFNCECPTDINQDECKCTWFLINETASECLSCDKNLGTDDYYARVLTKDNEAFCKSLYVTGFPYTKIIKGTHQIVDDCKQLGLMELGDECMHQLTVFEFSDYMEDGKQIVEGVYETRELNCIYGYYVKIDNNGMKIHKCLKQSESCPTGYRYMDSETKECLYKCPEDKPKITVLDNKNYYICSKECNYKDGDNIYDKKFTRVSSLDRSKSIDYCYKVCPKESHYYYEDDKICREDCNSKTGGFILSDDDGKCSNNIKDCTINSFFIRNKMNPEKIYIKCAVDTFNDKCPSDFIYKYELNGRIYCTNDCSGISSPCTEISTFTPSTSYFNGEYNYIKNSKSILGCNQYIYEQSKICLDTCEPNSYYYSLKENNRCENTQAQTTCDNKYFNDTSMGIQYCLENNNCENSGYPILNDGENICTETCNDILSIDGKTCYKDLSKCTGNTKYLSKNGIKQCFCQNKYYYDNSINREKLMCQNADYNCGGTDRPLLINETNECVKYCPYKEYTKKYGDLCLRECPDGFGEIKDECICSKKHYTEGNQLICTDTCPPSKSLIANETECVSKCDEVSYFPFYFKGKCYSENNKPHNNLTTLVINNENDKYEGKLQLYYGEYSSKIFYCPGVWYENTENDIYTYECQKGEQNSCNIFKNSYKYFINPLRRCVKNCSSTDFKYYFNNNCFSSCDKGNEYLNFGDGKNIKNGSSFECVCEGYWKYNKNEKECVKKEENKLCENDSYLLILATNECYLGTKCRKEHPKLFNGKCYDECPDNSDDFQGNENVCNCTYYWYEDATASIDKIKCLGINDKCPDGYPFLIVSERKCINEAEVNNLKDKYRFNKNIYDSGCPVNSTSDSTDKYLCVCNPALGYWVRKEDTFYNCSLGVCPESYILVDKKTKECDLNCNSFKYNAVCYSKCPEMTSSPNETLKICELKSDYNINELEEVKEKIINNSVIVDLYYFAEGKYSDGRIEIKDGDDIIYIVEYYGLNPNNDDYKSEHNNKDKPSSSLSYIDLIECINNLYKDNGMNSTDDIIVVKFDKVDTPKEYLINPVEYKFFHPVSGKELDMSACYNKKIKISYPFSKILEKYEKNLKKQRNLETVKLDIKSEDISSLIEKYHIAKKVNEEFPQIDIFNSGDYIYTNYCSSIQINGKDIVIEDRINFLYPHYALCEQNCTYNHTDYKEERIYCDCTLKTEFDIKRDHPENVVINENAIDLSKHGPTNFPVLKCIAIWKDFKRILQTIPIYYHIAILVVEIILLVLTLILGIKNMQNYFQNRICNLNKVEDDNVIEINEKKKIKNKKIKNGYIKTTDRNLENPPKKNNGQSKDKVNNKDNNEVQFIPDEYIFLYFTNKDKGVRKQIQRQFLPFEVNENTKILLQKMKGVDYTNVKASGPFKANQNILELEDDEPKTEELIPVSEKNSENKANQEVIYKKKEPKTYFINDNDELVEDKKYDVELDDLTCFDKFKIEHRLLRKEYEIALYKQENGFLFLMLAEILDKIYIMKIVLFRQDYDIIYINLSIYLLYHVFLVNIITMFFDMKTIQKIWNNESYPGMGLYLGYGLASIMVCWIVYIIFTCLMTNKGKYSEILDIKKSKKKDNKMKLVEKKYNSLKRKTKIKITLYSIIQFLFIIFFTIYSVTFSAIFYGTMNKIYLNYFIAIIEVLAIKIIYGLVLSILRQVSLSYDKKGLYNAVLFMDNYIV